MKKILKEEELKKLFFKAVIGKNNKNKKPLLSLDDDITIKFKENMKREEFFATYWVSPSSNNTSGISLLLSLLLMCTNGYVPFIFVNTKAYGYNREAENSEKNDNTEEWIKDLGKQWLKKETKVTFLEEKEEYTITLSNEEIIDYIKNEYKDGYYKDMTVVYTHELDEKYGKVKFIENENVIELTNEELFQKFSEAYERHYQWSLLPTNEKNIRENKDKKEIPVQSGCSDLSKSIDRAALDFLERKYGKGKYKSEDLRKTLVGKAAVNFILKEWADTAFVCWHLYQLQKEKKEVVSILYSATPSPAYQVSKNFFEYYMGCKFLRYDSLKIISKSEIEMYKKLRENKKIDVDENSSNSYVSNSSSNSSPRNKIEDIKNDNKINNSSSSDFSDDDEDENKRKNKNIQIVHHKNTLIYSNNNKKTEEKTKKFLLTEEDMLHYMEIVAKVTEKNGKPLNNDQLESMLNAMNVVKKRRNSDDNTYGKKIEKEQTIENLSNSLNENEFNLK